MDSRKNVYKGVRTTEAADRLIEGLAETLNKYNQTLNGGGRVSASSLITYLFEDIASLPSKEERAKRLEQLLASFRFKSSKCGIVPTNKDIIKGIVREVVYDN